MTKTPKRVGLLGLGTVGSALVELLSARAELPLVLSRVLVRDLGKARAVLPPRRLLTIDAEGAIAGTDIVVELMGGSDLAADLMLLALEEGKRVVTANKAALAERWREFRPYLAGGRLYFEAAVMAGTPVIGPLTGALRGSRPLELHAILNGTCNYILGKFEQGVAYGEALEEAQKLGYAEADPTLDVDGIDAAHKLTLLARLVFDPDLDWEEVRGRTRGIRRLTPAVVREARKRGGYVRLLASVIPAGDSWRAEVRPAYLPAEHPLAALVDSRNGLLFKGDAVGEVFISGAGAGGKSTASAVLADLMAALSARPGPGLLTAAAPPARGYRVDSTVEIGE